MKSITFTLLLLIFLGSTLTSDGQILKTLGDKAKNKINQRADSKVDQEMDKGLDEAEEGLKKKKKNDTIGHTEEVSEGQTGNVDEGFEYNSKYDFVPGAKLIAFEDFSNEEIGDFPKRWNTNSTAEIVSLNNAEGRWLKINKEGVFYPEFITDIPENFTLEFDLGVNKNWNGNHFALNIANLDSPNDFTDYYHYVSWRGNYAIHMELKPGQTGRVLGSSKLQASTDGNYIINNDVEFNVWDNTQNTIAHIALWRQEQRLRVYLNGEKIWDLPRAFDGKSSFNALTFALYGSNQPSDMMFLGNIKFAIGKVDTRHSLLSEGTYVTQGILFDVNSDHIKPQSEGVLKEIAMAIKESPNLKLKIIGHTDADGEDKFNLLLSEKRAQAVKNFFTEKFGLNEEGFIVEGKGETQLLDTSVSPEAKAQNRRVEFVKI